MKRKQQDILWWTLIAFLIILISLLHYTTPTMRWQFHLIYMQSYFIPILIAAFRFGLKGGIGSALFISIVYFPHVMMQWGGLIETNLLRFLQIILFNVIGFITGYLAQRQQQETKRYQTVAARLEETIHEIRSQTEKIQLLEDQLRSSDRLAIVGELTASLAHEIRNPLASMRGTVEIIRDQLPGLFKNADWVEIMQSEIERLNRVVENYLNFSHKRVSHNTKFDIREIISNIQLMLGAQFRKHNIELEVTVPDFSLEVLTNPDDLWQVLTNLLLNALQSITRETGGMVKIKAFAHGHAIVIEIEDEGCGITADKLDKIYQPFYTTKEDGTGLGLAIVKRIVETHQWDIHIQSTEGQGTQVKLILPTVPDAA